jgi:hypothetical protein
MHGESPGLGRKTVSIADGPRAARTPGDIRGRVKCLIRFAPDEEYNSHMAPGRTPEPGAIAPDFELPDSTGQRRRLSNLVSQNRLVLLFYRGNW